ncbi:hypothetical protein Scep_006455 [Stephania cephalantha]|uniref:LysM domain-containing protein n=1 Tax=Stephania cephalantha TaxID=152367 RepID=A0AAP0PK34_9MAGN
MASSSSSSSRPIKLTQGMLDLASLCCATALLCFILLGTVIKDASSSRTLLGDTTDDDSPIVVKGDHILGRPCDEIYVVGEGETLHTISDKCGDPFIVEQNPHIHDPDDVFPGLVIKITTSNKARKLVR